MHRLGAIAVVVGALAAETAPRPAAEFQYLQQSGWVVRTPGYVLVFDYVETSPVDSLLPSQFRLSPDSFDQRKVIVFVTHGHADHFFPGIGAWAKKRPDIQYVLGWPEASLPGAKVMRPHDTWSSGGLTVAATNSTDEGVGFLVGLDGLRIFHAGDHARWSEADDQAFMAEILWLKSQGHPIDVALFAIATGAACEPRPSIWDGVRSVALALRPRVLLPMHVACTDRLDLYERFRAKVGSDLPETQVVAPARLGQLFRYEAGHMAVQ